MYLKLSMVAAFGLAFGRAACGGEEPDAAKGEELFTSKREAGIDIPIACSDCHQFGPRRPGDGPAFIGIAEIAASRVEGLTAEEYIRQPILDPEAFLPSGYFSTFMPKTYGEILTEEEIEDIIAYILSHPDA